MVAYNYFDSSPKTGMDCWHTLARTMWEDSAVFGSPHALEYDANTDTSFDVVATQKAEQHTINTKQGLIKLKVGLLQLLAANIASGDFDISQRRSALGQTTGGADLRGDGEFIMKIRRFIPNTLYLKQVTHKLHYN